MANLSSFFPVAAGGGGFSKMLKFTTLRSSDGNYKGSPATTINVSGDTFPPSTSLAGQPTTSADRSLLTAQDSLVGATFTNTNGGTVHTVTASAAHNANSYFSITFTPALTHSIANNVNLNFNTAGFTINPNTDLGLSDGDSIGYLLCGGGYSSPYADRGGKGGKILYGTATISDASVDLVITPGGGPGVNSTISGGLTLSSGDGSNPAGGSDVSGSSTSFSSSSGIMGYGVGGGGYSATHRPQGSDHHGWGTGGFQYTGVGGDGAILLYY